MSNAARRPILAIIINARSGGVSNVHRQDELESALNLLKRRRPEHELLRLQDEADFRALSTKLAFLAPDEVMVVGGDGTLKTVIQSLDTDRTCTIGFLPLGTMNIYARRLGISLDPREAAAQFLDGTSQPLVIGALNCGDGQEHRFMLQALTGPLVSVQRLREQARIRGWVPTLFSRLLLRCLSAVFTKKRAYIIEANGEQHRLTSRLLVVLTPTRPKQPLSVTPFELPLSGYSAHLLDQIYTEPGLPDMEEGFRRFAESKARTLVVRRASGRRMIWLLDGELVSASKQAELSLVENGLELRC